MCAYLSLYLSLYCVLILVSPFPPGAQLQVRSLVFLDQQVRLTGFTGGTGRQWGEDGQSRTKTEGGGNLWREKRGEKTWQRRKDEWGYKVINSCCFGGFCYRRVYVHVHLSEHKVLRSSVTQRWKSCWLHLSVCVLERACLWFCVLAVLVTILITVNNSSKSSLNLL